MSTMPLVPMIAPAAAPGAATASSPTTHAGDAPSDGRSLGTGFAALIADLLGGGADVPPTGTGLGAGAEAGTAGDDSVTQAGTAHPGDLDPTTTGVLPTTAATVSGTETEPTAPDLPADPTAWAADPTALIAIGLVQVTVPAALQQATGCEPTTSTAPPGQTVPPQPATPHATPTAGAGAGAGPTDAPAAAVTTALGPTPAGVGGLDSAGAADRSSAQTMPPAGHDEAGTASTGPADAARAAVDGALANHPERPVTAADPAGRHPRHEATGTGAISLDGLGLTATASSTAAAGTAGVTGTATTDPTGAPALARSITDQVHGRVVAEVTRLASDPNRSSHRMTLRLDPGTLGEVRVVLAMRDGAVRVRLAAHEVAHEALAAAAPELRRLLEDAGQQARVVVRELATPPAGVAPAAPSSDGGHAGDTTGQGQASASRSDLTDSGNSQTRQGGEGREQGRWAGTPTAPSARDGIRDAIARPGDPLTRRLAGVDVSM